ncbi:unnamed protein product [Paramecium sonneborni]|uniref:Phospholipid scramblase n=1 Tax=Paramecium sonneborni TaxID=65129 RepID=A0A8S1MVS7_9CILI|nr:unnamed protein product [Paramecium sonneborni]
MLQTSIIITSTPSYIERFSPFICACPICPCITCLQPCEQANEYSIIYCEDDWSNWGQVHFEVKEVSKFMQRFICPPSKRSLELVDQRKFSEVHIKVEKPYKFSFLCFQRPEMLIYQRGQYIGKVMEELQWTWIKCTFYKLTCFDKNNALLYTISASCCQPGLFCMLPCQSCAEIEFQIKDRNNQKVGKICHLFGGFRREWCTKSDTYGINFPEFATIEEKIILIMAGIFIDYAQFQNY